MTQRTAFIIAGALTVFLLVLVGATASYVTQVTAQASAKPAAVQATPDASSVARLMEREAAYRQAIDQANDRLRQASAQLEQANARLRQPVAQAAPTQPGGAASQSSLPIAAAVQPASPASFQTQAVTPAPAPSSAQSSAPDAGASAYPVSAETAATIALGVAPGARLIRTPGLVSFQGAVAYETVLDRGSLYIDATTGRVLDNGADAASSSNVQPRGTSAAEGGERHRERGEGDDEGDDDD